MENNELTPEEREMLESSLNSTGSPLTAEEEELLTKTVEEAHQEIPMNSTTSLIHNTTSRFTDAIWYNEIQKQSIILAGLGGIGSYVGFLLARMKPHQLVIYDNDIVESSNMSGQLYGSNDLGNYKANALSDMIRRYADYYNVYAVTEKYTENSDAHDIMICGFDNMKARKTFFSKWYQHINAESVDRSKCILIDGRLAAEEFQIFAIQGNDERAIEDYRTKWLFDDSQADPTICSYKQTTFCANMIGSIMVNIFVNFIANQLDPLMDRDVPYYTVYDASTMYFKTEA